MVVGDVATIDFESYYDVPTTGTSLVPKRRSNENATTRLPWRKSFAQLKIQFNLLCRLNINYSFTVTQNRLIHTSMKIEIDYKSMIGMINQFID